ncbi:transcriptional regulator [Brucella suis]|nr:transcriptional regulator [Brucella suis]
MADADDSLALRAAWLHFVAGMTQSAVAKRLGLPSVRRIVSSPRPLPTAR